MKALAAAGRFLHCVCVADVQARINVQILLRAEGPAGAVSGIKEVCAVRKICAAYTRRRELLVLLFHF